MKNFCFTVDDNIRFLKDLTKNNYSSIFEHPYLAVYKRLYEEFGLKVQLNLFYRLDDFTLSDMTDVYYGEFRQNSHWLKLSFHSEYENEKPYEFSGYKKVFSHCRAVNEQIERFASPAALAKTTTIHYCLTTKRGLKALKDNNIKGLLGLFGTDEKPNTSYCINKKHAKNIRSGEIYNKDGISFASIDVILNCFSKQEILNKLENLKGREAVRVMIHEQYFYSDYCNYQPDFEEKLRATFSFFKENNYDSCFFEELI